MSDTIAPTRTPKFEAHLKKRYASEKRFKALGLTAILFSVAMLAFLLVTMTLNGFGGFQRVEAKLEIDFAANPVSVPESFSNDASPVEAMRNSGLPEIIAFAAEENFGPVVAAEISSESWREVAEKLISSPSRAQEKSSFYVPVTADLAAGYSGEGSAELQEVAAKMRDAGQLEKRLDLGFLTRADATDPQQVGIWAALKGSMLTMLVTLVLAFPIGVLAALYLEEYAPKNRWTDVIEVSINNLAAVPSIIFGLLGLAVFLTIFPNYRSAPLIGGMTLALMTMPVIVISGRNAIKAVPPSIRDGALAIGASPVQVVFHHVLPLALPGILTGTIIGMARALGETAPLLMIGMRVFIASPPDGFTSPSSVLPVQIFLWSDEIDRGFVERTSAAIIVLLVFLLVMNALAIYLRNRFEKKW